MSVVREQAHPTWRRLLPGLLALLLLALPAAPAHARAAGRTNGTGHHPSAHGYKAGAGARRSATAPAGVLAPTPYMGWDTYFTFGAHFNEASVLAQASQLVTRGLAREGYRYVWLDVGWWQGTRNAAGEITVSATQWPHGMKWLTSTLHAAGLKVGSLHGRRQRRLRRRAPGQLWALSTGRQHVCRVGL